MAKIAGLKNIVEVSINRFIKKILGYFNLDAKIWRASLVPKTSFKIIYNKKKNVDSNEKKLVDEIIIELNKLFESAQKRLNRGLSVCIFPEGGVPYDESIVLDTFKDGAFRLAIEHQIPIVPISFGDNKKRLSFTFFSGSIGLMRVKIHAHVDTKGKTSDDRRALKEEVHEIIYNQLVAFGN
jgi:1-acyl-sn-glycerol-3-phosphate acyltransferase